MHTLSRFLCSVTFLASGIALAQSTTSAFSFSSPKVTPLPSQVAAGQFDALDLNGDGKTDLAVWLNSGLFVYLGDGVGDFSHPVHLQLNDPNTSLPMWLDINGDGKTDGVVAYDGYYDSQTGGAYYDGQFEVWLGDGLGGMTKTAEYDLGPGFSHMISGDFNKDGKRDFAVVTDNYQTNTSSALTVFLNTGSGTFRVSQFVSLGADAQPAQMAVGDFNGDGKLDIAWIDRHPVGSATDGYALHYRYGNGNGTFGTDHTYTFDGAPIASIAAADLNHDGRTDLVVGGSPKQDPMSGITRPDRVVTLLAKSTGGFEWFSTVSLPSQVQLQTVSLQDFNGDGQLDLLVNPVSGQNVYVAAGSSTGKFAALQTITGFSQTSHTQAIQLVKGGRPALIDTTSSGSTSTISVRLDTTK